MKKYIVDKIIIIILRNKKVELSQKSADDCKNRKTYTKDDKCCYQYGSKQKEKGECVLIDKYEYENIGKVIKRMKLYVEIYKDAPKEDSDNSGDYGDPHIDCNSQYAKLSLIIGFILILF